MITLKHKTSQETIVVTYQEYENIPDLINYEPLKAEDMVEVYKANGEGGMSSFLVTDKTTGYSIQSKDHELYAKVVLWDNKSLQFDLYLRTLSPDDFARKVHDEFDV